MTRGLGLFWVAIVLFAIFFGPADCAKQDSIATAIVKHLEAK